MRLDRSSAVAPELSWAESCPSTNSDLVRAAAELTDFTVLATTDQTAGRGRLDRVWSAPAGASLAVSVFVKNQSSDVDLRRIGWLPLLAGVAMTRAVRELGVARAGVKWPNDVLVGSRKIAGILTELTGHGVVIGAGLNLTMTSDQLPVPTATSLVLEGVIDETELVDRALAAYLSALAELITRWRSGADSDALRAIVEPVLVTLGSAVRVDRGGFEPLRGIAERLDDDGLLLVRTPDTQLVAVSAGDVTHLRYE
jgi:BirA family transcriptional regulator, biotin operon repressor / biotin---[acetyl-CoA-carboxylase] ligase